VIQPYVDIYTATVIVKSNMLRGKNNRLNEDCLHLLEDRFHGENSSGSF